MIACILATVESVLVTGSSSGIGRATVLHLDAAGFRVFAGVRQDADGLELKDHASEHFRPVKLDVIDGESIERAAGEVREALDGDSLGAVVNNAGITTTWPLEFVDLNAMRHQFEVNVFGVAAVTRAFLPMLARPGGRIVNVSSGAGKIVTPLIGPYCASKFALEALSDALRVELRGQGIRVSVIEPGFIETPMHEKNEQSIKAMLDALPPEGQERYGASIQRLRKANERFTKTATPPEEVAKSIHKALSANRPRARYAVTREAKLLAAIGPFLSDRMRDRIFGRITGL